MSITAMSFNQASFNARQVFANTIGDDEEDGSEEMSVIDENDEPQIEWGEMEEGAGESGVGTLVDIRA